MRVRAKRVAPERALAHLRRLLPPLFALVGLLVTAPAAMAADGVGIYGRTTDKAVTFFALGRSSFG